MLNTLLSFIRVSKDVIRERSRNTILFVKIFFNYKVEIYVYLLLESKRTHMLFIDSDIYFHSPSIFKMIEKDKELISIPYPLKVMMWDKLFDKFQQGQVKETRGFKKMVKSYPMKVSDPNSITLDNGVMEVTHSPTGCMLIKRSVFEKMIKAYPDKGIVQKTVINGKYVDRPHMWNFRLST